MANKSSTSKRKKPVSHKRVALVLTALIVTLTISAGLLLALERQPITVNNPSAFATDVSTVTDVQLRPDGWQFIIVYESGTVAASAADLAEGRLPGGNPDNAARPGANFHFVVDSARGADGELFRGSAWSRQELGAPDVAWPVARNYSHSSYTNKVGPYANAIGVCLTGDVRSVSGRQVNQLTSLVKDLREKTKISADRILFQWELQDPNKISPAQKTFADAIRSRIQ